MNVVEQVKEYVDKNLQKSGAGNLLEALSDLHGKLTHSVGQHNEINEAFKKVGKPNYWIDCPGCQSPVLLEYAECPYCEVTLMEVEDAKDTSLAEKKEEVKEEEVKEVKEVKEVAKKKVTKKKTAKKKVTKKKVERVSKPVAELEEIVTESEELSEDDYPSEDEINKMLKPALQKAVKDFGLDVDVKDFKKIGDLRDAVNDAIDEKLDGAGEMPELKTEEESEDDDSGDIDLDGLDFDDIDDIDDLGDEED